MNDTTTAPDGATPPPGLAVGLGIFVVVVVGLVAWTWLMVPLVTPLSLFGGYLMLWYWANVEQLSMRRLPAALAGALVGIAIAWVLVYGPAHYGGTGLAVGLILLLAALYLDIVKRLPTFVNASTMLYVTVAAAPLVQLKVDWIELVIATVSGGLFFAGFVAAVQWLAQKAFGSAS